MRHPPGFGGIENVIGAAETRSYVIGIQNSHFRRLGETLTAHQQDIGPAHRQNRGRSKRCRGYGPDVAAMFWVTG